MADIIFEKKELDDSMIELTGTIPVDLINKEKAILVKKYKETKNFDGFRKGEALESVVEKTIGEVELINQSARSILANQYPTFVTKKELNVIGLPTISITKAALGSPVDFSIKVVLSPTFELPDYKSLSKKFKLEVEDVKDGDVNLAIENIRKSLYLEKNKDVKFEDVDVSKLPELQDEDVKKFSANETVDEFKKTLKQNIKREKEIIAKSKLRGQISKEILDNTPFNVPRVLIDDEVEKMFLQLKEDAKKFNTTIEEYLKHIKKTEDGLKTEWEKVAEDRVRLQMIIAKIAEKEKIEINQSDIDKEVEILKKRFGEVDENSLKLYVNILLTNEKIFNLLESQS